jgi:hypothetical protein
MRLPFRRYGGYWPWWGVGAGLAVVVFEGPPKSGPSCIWV